MNNEELITLTRMYFSGTNGIECPSTPFPARHPCFPPPFPNFLPGVHPALQLPNVLPFIAAKRQQEEAMLAAAMRQRISFMQSMAAATQLSPPTLPFPPVNFMHPMFPRVPFEPVMRPVFPTSPTRSKDVVPVNPPKPNLAKPREPQLSVDTLRLKSEKEVETVNGGFGVKNPLAKNPALQDHMLQTMGEWKSAKNYKY